MIILAHPWILLLLVLPLVLRYLLPAYQEQRSAMRLPWFNRIASLSGGASKNTHTTSSQSRWEMLVLMLLWGLLVLAMARPQMLEPPLSKTVATRDLLLLVDLSGSMETEDFTNKQGKQVSRLDAVKDVLDDFLTRRQGDRVGLVVFGNAAFVQVPFTQDLEVTRQLLNEAQVLMAGPRTAFGDAIGLGITLFARSEFKERVMIALTDGNDTGSKVPPVEAARIARDEGIGIHVIGIGNPEAVGEEKFDESVLKQVAEITGAKYFHAGNRERLGEVYAELDRLDTREVETQTHQPRTDLFHWPLAAFFLFSMIHQVILGRHAMNLKQESGHG